jgi:hypothetical protein
MAMSALLGVTVIADKIGVMVCVSHITDSIRKANLSLSKCLDMDRG